MKSHSESYRNAGVDITAGYKAVELMKPHIARTRVKGAFMDIGGFGGLFEPDLNGISNPVLVSGTDGVGSKLKLAFYMDKHDTVGIDCVAMCVNDIICCGAKPMFFLDYIALGKNVPERVANIVSGIAEGCVQAGCALIGGETAEMPGFYAEDEYDLAGFSVGIVDRGEIFDNTSVKAGDVLIALPSSGVHSNGFSLIRKIFGISDDDNGASLALRYAGLENTLGEELLKPTRIYVGSIMALKEQVKVKAVTHITGGGFYENIPRGLPEGLAARICKRTLKTPAIFDIIQSEGTVPERDMFNTFNMGVGMTVIVAQEEADKAVNLLNASGLDAYLLGDVVSGSEGVIMQ